MKIVRNPELYAWTIWSIGAMLFLLSSGIIALPSILTKKLELELGFSPLENGLVSIAYLIPYNLLQAPIGSMISRYGYKKVLIASCVLLIMGSVLFAGIQGIAGAIISRFILGIGSAGIFLACILISKEQFEPRRFALLVAILESLAVVSLILLPFVFALFNEMITWRYLSIVLCLIYGLIAILITSIFRSPLQASDSYQQPIFSQIKKVCQNKTLLLTALYVSCLYAHIAVFSNMWRLPMILSRFDISTTKAILINSYSAIGYILGAILFSYLTKRFWVGKLMFWGAILQLVFQFASHLFALTSYYLPHQIILISYYCSVFLMGLATGAIVLSFEFLREVIPDEYYGIAAGILNLSFGAIAIVISPVVGYLLAMLHFQQWGIIIILMYSVSLFGVAALILSLKRHPQ